MRRHLLKMAPHFFMTPADWNQENRPYLYTSILRVVKAEHATDHAMKELLNRPMLSAMLLVIPLWIVLGNFVVAAMVALLVAFFASVIHSLRVLKRHESQAQRPHTRNNDNKGYDR